MPNHVTTLCYVTGPEDDIARFRAECIRPDDGVGEPTLDFNAIIPRPAILDETVSGSRSHLGFEALGLQTSSILRRTPDDLLNRQTVAREHLALATDEERDLTVAETLKSIEAILRTGHPDWYEWSIANWGTKWGAYSYSDDIEVPTGHPGQFAFRFCTAWSFPEPIFEALAEKYRTLVFEATSFDDGWNFALRATFCAEGSTVQNVGAEPGIYEEVFGFPPDVPEEEEEAVEA